ncbi:hypothetical protein D3C80_1396540 [compost metagenome]
MRATQVPIQRRTSCPATNGTSSCATIFSTASRLEPLSPSTPISSTTSNGVSTMPSRLDAAALQIAAGTLPRASEVKAMADCTVAGKAHRYSTPRYSSSPTSGRNNGLNSMPSNGNITKVQANTSRCRRQCPAPAATASRDNLAPCKKNSRPMARLVSPPNTTAPLPSQGNRVAMRMTPSNARVKLSNSIRRYFMAAPGLLLWRCRR